MSFSQSGYIFLERKFYMLLLYCYLPEQTNCITAYPLGYYESISDFTLSSWCFTYGLVRLTLFIQHPNFIKIQENQVHGKNKEILYDSTANN